MTMTPSARAALQRVSDPQGLVFLLSINGGGMEDTLRIVDDTRDFVSQGHTFLGVPFQSILPTEAPKELPRSSVRIDNVGRELTQLLEQLPLGAELMATLQVVYRAEPDHVLYGFTAPMSDIEATIFAVHAVIGVSTLLSRSVVAIRFDPHTAPGLFPN